MPPRKRTTSKHTPPTSPTTTTSHTSADHHHLRHTGPSISTRTRASTSSKPPVQQETAQEISEKKPLAEVSPSGALGQFSKFMYVLLFCALLLFGWYIYGMVTLLERLKDEVGWWGIIVGNSGAEACKGWGYGPERPEAARRGDLEGSLNALADMLGISPVQVASAVKPLVPQASLMNIASKAEESDSSEAVRILIEDTTPSEKERENKYDG